MPPGLSIFAKLTRALAASVSTITSAAATMSAEPAGWCGARSSALVCVYVTRDAGKVGLSRLLATER